MVRKLRRFRLSRLLVDGCVNGNVDVHMNRSISGDYTTRIVLSLIVLSLRTDREKHHRGPTDRNERSDLHRK